MQEGFISRTENLLKIFHERSHIHDGLKNLSDEEVIRKVREGPTKLKRAAKSLLKKLQKFDIRLDNNGEVDYSRVQNKHVIDSMKKNETLVRLTLM
jgi:hypothetical protein